MQCRIAQLAGTWVFADALLLELVSCFYAVLFLVIAVNKKQNK